MSGATVTGERLTASEAAQAIECPPPGVVPPVGVRANEGGGVLSSVLPDDALRPPCTMRTAPFRGPFVPAVRPPPESKARNALALSSLPVGGGGRDGWMLLGTLSSQNFQPRVPYSGSPLRTQAC